MSFRFDATLLDLQNFISDHFQADPSTYEVVFGFPPKALMGCKDTQLCSFGVINGEVLMIRNKKSNSSIPNMIATTSTSKMVDSFTETSPLTDIAHAATNVNGFSGGDTLNYETERNQQRMKPKRRTIISKSEYMKRITNEIKKKGEFSINFMHFRTGSLREILKRHHIRPKNDTSTSTNRRTTATTHSKSPSCCTHRSFTYSLTSYEELQSQRQSFLSETAVKCPDCNKTLATELWMTGAERTNTIYDAKWVNGTGVGVVMDMIDGYVMIPI